MLLVAQVQADRCRPMDTEDDGTDLFKRVNRKPGIVIVHFSD